ncbi:MAG TPA: ABC transporter substrate-binding protein [Symbiobacteriaceae bacterium]|nr:ABC transporter substrate-binding protein [Symbiobacteriaceae bacterium]
MRIHRGKSRVAVAGLSIALLMGALAGCSSAKSPEQQPAGGTSKKPIKIGAVFILSGNNAGYGQAQKPGVELAAEAINKAGGIDGQQIQVIFEDSQGNPDEAVKAVRKLIDKDEVTAIIGPTLSTEMQKAGPIANEAGVPILGVSTTANGITDIGKYVFRNSLPEANVLPLTTRKAMAKHNLKNVALMWAANDAVSVGGYNIFKTEIPAAGMSLVAEASFQVKDTDFSAQLTQVLAKKPEAIFVSSLYQEAALLMVQARKAGFTGPFIGGNGFNSPALIDVAKQDAEGAIVGSPWYPGADSKVVKEFIAAYTAKVGKAPDQFSAQAYDGMSLVIEALKAAKSTDHDKVRDALAAIKNFEGVTGKFSFDEKRNPSMSPYILTVQNGKMTELK